MSGAFNPLAGTFGTWPTNPSKPAIAHGSTGDAVGYLRGTLYWDSGQTAAKPAANPGPWVFDVNVQQAVRNFQAFWGLPVTGNVDATTWGVLDYNCYLHGRQ